MAHTTRPSRSAAQASADPTPTPPPVEDQPEADQPEARGGPTRSGLPASVATFVGRHRERARVAALLGSRRALTLTGTGGCGKTRLALEVASDVEQRFTNGARWVELAGVADPDMVPTAVAAATDVHERRDQPLVDTLAASLRDRHLLVVLDNCEHLPAACAVLVTELLRACPRITVLATSREPLGVVGETTFDVPPLPVPGPGARTNAEVTGRDAGQLFELRAQQAQPDFRVTDDDTAAAVADICRRLDGIPLAIELAAARVRVLTPTQIAAALSDRFHLLTGGARGAPARQRTLEASVAWSYHLLDEAERRTLARLAVFAGDFELDAACAVAGEVDADQVDTEPVDADQVDAGERVEGREVEVLDRITALVEKSLIQVHHGDTARYRLLESIRMYARGRLVELDDPDQVRDRHLAFHVDLAERARAGLTGPDPEPWAARLAAGLNDLRAAMDWAIDSRQPLAVVEIVDPTSRFWFDRGLYPEMRRRLHAALETHPADDPVYARGLTAAALLAVGGGDHADGHTFATEAIAVARATGADDALVLALILRCWSGFASGLARDEELRADSDEAVWRAAQLGDEAMRAFVLMFAGRLAMSWDSLDAGSRVLEQTIAVCEEGDVAIHLPAAHAILGLWLVYSGDIGRAREHARVGLELGRRFDRPGYVVHGLTGLAAVDVLTGDEHRARAHLAEAEDVVRSEGLLHSIFDLARRDWLAITAYRFGALSEARAISEEARRAARDHRSRWNETWHEWLLGAVALCEDRRGDARRHLERCRELSADPHSPLMLGRSLLALAHLGATEGDVDDAWELAHEGLEGLAQYGDRCGSADALDALSGLHAASGKPDQAVRLLGATDRFRTELGIGRFPLEADRCARWRAAAEGQLDADRVAACRADGAALTLDEAIAYARRGRGERGRPPVGWSSLTPVERDVVRLVAEGHTNAEIGERLFMSVNTVKKHLSHVYTKVDVDGRAELAAEVTRRAL